MTDGITAEGGATLAGVRRVDRGVVGRSTSAAADVAAVTSGAGATASADAPNGVVRATGVCIGCTPITDDDDDAAAGTCAATGGADVDDDAAAGTDRCMMSAEMGVEARERSR